MTLSDTVGRATASTAITVAWLSQLNAFAMIVISLMLAILSKGREGTLQTAPDGADVDLRHHHRHPAVLHARLRVLHQLSGSSSAASRARGRKGMMNTIIS